MGKVPKLDIAKLINTTKYAQKDAEECADLITKMIRWVPWERVSAKEAFEHPFVKDVRI